MPVDVVEDVLARDATAGTGARDGGGIDGVVGKEAPDDRRQQQT